MPDDPFLLACSLADIPKEGAKNVNLDGAEITIFKTPEGFVARSGVCKHNAFKLELCDIMGDVITCPLHGWKYRISTGQGIKPSWTCLDSYPLELRGKEIWVKPIIDDTKQDEFDTTSYQW